MMVRTRFAPSPTGYLHIGGARTALFSWAFARKHGGKFVLRIEDTDLERSTQESVQAILDGMAWLNLNYDEGPYYQMQRLARYQEVAEQLLRTNQAYYCYATKEELDLLRESQRAAGQKPRYDGRWRDNKSPPPKGIKPVIRLKNPLEGEVVFDDLVKGRISVANNELDDLVLMRGDGTPTYNFGVVLDDLDMRISHVIRGDDHVNNTPRQINILKALNASLPQYAHVPMILGADGERLSKRHGAVSVMHYHEEGYLPKALVNYLARLGWSHGDDEIFSSEQLIEWFDLESINRAPAKFNPEKLQWLNQHYLKAEAIADIAHLTIPFLEKDNCVITNREYLHKVVNLLKDRVSTISELADAAVYFFRVLAPSEELRTQHFNDETKTILTFLMDRFSSINWDKQLIHDEIKNTATAFDVKLHKIAMPLRVAITGEVHTPSIDAVLEILGKSETLDRLNRQIATL